MCRYGKENLDRLAMALGGNVIVPSCPVCLFKFLHDEDWKIRHAAITAIGLISEGCSKVLFCLGTTSLPPKVLLQEIRETCTHYCEPNL